MLQKHLQPTARGLNLAVGPDRGPPLLMLHGVTRNWRTFLPLLPAMTTRWQVSALDFRGHGESKPASDGYRVVDYAEDAAAALRSLPRSKVVLYGHSLGAMVAALIAGDQAERVAGLIMEDPPLHAMGNRLAGSVLQSLFEGMEAAIQEPAAIPELTGRLSELVLRNPLDGATMRLGEIRDAASLRFTASSLSKLDPQVLTPITAGRWLEGYDIEAVFPRIHCPVLLLQADPTHGGMLSDEDAERIEALCGDCTRIRFPQTAHLIHWLETQKLLNTVTAFLESQRDAFY